LKKAGRLITQTCLKRKGLEQVIASNFEDSLRDDFQVPLCQH